MRMHLTDVPVGENAPHEVNVVIEITQGTSNKVEYDTRYGAFVVFETSGLPSIRPRTGARALLGLDAAMRRTNIHAQAGAGALFVESRRSVGEFGRILREVSRPPMAKMRGDGRTPNRSATEIDRASLKVAVTRPETPLFRGVVEAAVKAGGRPFRMGGESVPGSPLPAADELEEAL